MKKLIAIVLIALILFNTMGFYGLLEGLRYKASLDLVQRLDEDQYHEKETITIKVPLAIPYNTDDHEYERVDGEIEHSGEIYRLVKQKLVQDTLFIVCIKDKKSKHIKRALADYVKTFTDKPVQGKQSSKADVTFAKDYLGWSCSITGLNSGWSRSILPASFLSSYNRTIPSVPGPPPKV